MPDKPRHAAQKKFIAKQQAAGLKRVIQWARPEDIDDLKLAAQQPHSLAKLRAQIETDIRAELEPKIRVKVAAELKRKTERAMLVQKRKAARLQPADSNAPPERLRFKARPPGSIRKARKRAG